MRKKRRTFWDYNEMGIFFYQQEAYDLAISEFRQAVQASMFPMAALHINLGAAYLGKKLYREARAALDEGLAIEPDNQKGHLLLGQALLGVGDAGQALGEFERALALDPASSAGESATAQIARLRAVLHLEDRRGTRRCDRT